MDLPLVPFTTILKGIDFKVMVIDPNQDYFVKVASHLENGKWVSDKLDDMSPHEVEKNV